MEERYCYQGTTKGLTYAHKNSNNTDGEYVCICPVHVCMYICLERERE
jgi:hypothetical protein